MTINIKTNLCLGKLENVLTSYTKILIVELLFSLPMEKILPQVRFKLRNNQLCTLPFIQNY